MKREFDKKVKLPASGYGNCQNHVRGQQIWVQAQEYRRFFLICTSLKKIFELKRQEAEAIGYDDCPYDALLDEYEPRATTRQVALVLEALRKDLIPLVSEIADSQAEISTDILPGIILGRRKRNLRRPQPPPLVSTINEAGWTKLTTRSVQNWDHTIAESPRDSTKTSLVQLFLEHCMKPGTGCTIKDCVPSITGYRPADIAVSEFMSLSRDCGRILLVVD